MNKKNRLFYWAAIGIILVSAIGLSACGQENSDFVSESVLESVFDEETSATDVSDVDNEEEKDMTSTSVEQGYEEKEMVASSEEENSKNETMTEMSDVEKEDVEQETSSEAIPTPESIPESTPAPTPQPTPVPTPKPKSKYQIVSEKIGLKVDQIEIDLPSVSGNYTLLFISDMHILNEDASIFPEKLEELRVRKDIAFKTSTNMKSSDTWLELSSVLDAFGANGIIFGGDMVDFASSSNYRTLSEGLSQIATPYIYLRADHDLGTWYSSDFANIDESIQHSRNASDYQDVFVMEYPEFYVVGWNNSTSQLTENGLNTICGIWNNQKPIILATHVPLNSIVDTSLETAASGADTSGRKKLWGKGCLYVPDSNTDTLLGMVYDPNSPVKAVVSGHLHFKHTVMLDDNTIEYVFAPTYSGNIAKIIVK